MKLDKIVTMLPVADVGPSVEFYVNVLGFEVRREHAGWGWALLARDGCELMLDQSIKSAAAKSGAVTYLYTDDVEEYWRQVRERGCAAEAPEMTFYGMKEFRLVDPDGNQVWIGQYPVTDADSAQGE